MKRYLFYVYIVGNYTGTLYIGVTNNLQRRLSQHTFSTFKDSFTSRYRIKRLLYFEEFNDIRVAIGREKQIKRWSRVKKLDLIRTKNPSFEDLRG
ncbi:MAG: GIY-YIG nuclease family protein [Candidatus Dojkabacteria bacterium]